MTPFDEVRLSAFVSARGIEQRPPRAEVDLTCPYLSDDSLARLAEQLEFLGESGFSLPARSCLEAAQIVRRAIGC